jgi:hypothetical protein
MRYHKMPTPKTAHRETNGPGGVRGGRKNDGLIWRDGWPHRLTLRGHYGEGGGSGTGEGEGRWGEWRGKPVHYAAGDATI